MIPRNVNVEILCKGKWNLFGKIIATIKLLKNIIFPKKYYASICYPHQHGVLALITRKESENNIIFIHTDLLKSRTDKELNELNKTWRWIKEHRRTPDGQDKINEDTKIKLMLDYHIAEDLTDYEIYLQIDLQMNSYIIRSKSKAEREVNQYGKEKHISHRLWWHNTFNGFIRKRKACRRYV